MPTALMCSHLLSTVWTLDTGAACDVVRPVPQLDYAGVVGFVLVLFLTVRSAGAAVQCFNSRNAQHETFLVPASPLTFNVLQGWITVQCIIRSFPALPDGLPTGGFGSTGDCFP